MLSCLQSKTIRACILMTQKTTLSEASIASKLVTKRSIKYNMPSKLKDEKQPQENTKFVMKKNN